MATLFGDYGPSRSTGFHTMIATQGMPYSQQHQDHPSYRSGSHPRDSAVRRPSQTRQRSPPRNSTTHGEKERDSTVASSASRLPSPPDSSSPSGSAGSVSRPESNTSAPSRHGKKEAYMDSSIQAQAAVSSAGTGSSSITHTQHNPSSSHITQAIPSPVSDAGGRWTSSTAQIDSTLAAADAHVIQQTTIHVRDLAHVESLARNEMNTSGTDDPPLQAMKYEISGMPIGDIIEMVAALLTKITTTNDLQHDALSRNAVERNASHVKQAQAQNDGSATEYGMSPLSSSVLAFHGKNIPAITILSYLSRIHKYCPTTYEVFLSLLVYFDRMTERVNDMVMKAEEAKKQAQGSKSAQTDVVMKDDVEDASDGDLDEDIADDSESDHGRATGTARPSTAGPSSATGSSAPASAPVATQPTFFVVDSFNIHRLIIAGVTCSSKFFSDVFYTNSRYAKVGGLPLAELNHLEIQFLVLNDFRLAVPVEDLEAYATMLVEFYAREVVGQQPQHHPRSGSSLPQGASTAA
ncbi:cyclin-domain-containing protein [Coniella lustricola]|uniref:Cyclin-domain-containing protein n=1 Tax=Coniella lustricola TaxID=2025994 RepID=A0A2T3ADF2_9PEZI|nr:cyclin-domain-containing protein [Coniella lustricola]